MELNYYPLDGRVLKQVLGDHINHTPRTVRMPRTQLLMTTCVTWRLDHLGKPVCRLKHIVRVNEPKRILANEVSGL